MVKWVMGCSPVNWWLSTRRCSGERKFIRQWVRMQKAMNKNICFWFGLQAGEEETNPCLYLSHGSGFFDFAPFVNADSILRTALDIHSFTRFPGPLLTNVPQCLGLRHVFTCSPFCSKIMCMSWNLSKDVYEKVEWPRWWVIGSFSTSWGAEGGKEVGMEVLNNVPRKRFVWLEWGKVKD